MNTQEFNLLKKRQLLYGFNACGENANSHFQTAIICADKNCFGIANSHLILAAEEAIKAQHFLMKYLKPNDHLNVDGLFHNHQSKHVAGFDFFKSLKRTSTMLFKQMSEISIKIIEKTKDQNRINEWKENIKEANEFQKSFQSTKIKSWWKKANNQKNNGFYVDYRKNKWSTPKKDILKNDYLKSYAIVGHFLFINAIAKDSLNSS